VQARALYARMHAADPAARVAVVAWLGYCQPSELNLDAIREDVAGPAPGRWSRSFGLCWRSGRVPP
jgi:hypothetical protein